MTVTLPGLKNQLTFYEVSVIHFVGPVFWGHSVVWLVVLKDQQEFKYESCKFVTNQPPKANSAFHPSGVGK